MKLRTLLLAISLTVGAASAGEVSIALPAEMPVFKPAPGAELVQANCLICHSSEYIALQPPKPRDFWEATMKKMIEKYGAAPTPEAAAQIVDYLTANYGQPAPKP